MAQGLTVLAAIRPGEEKRLREVLRPIGDDIRGRTLTDVNRPHIDFPRSRTIHFARFAILDDPNRGPERKRLLYSSNYDGDLNDHLAELVAITSDLDTIWGHCEGYAGAARFEAFIRAHAREPEAFYIAFRDDTVERIRQVIALRQRVQSLLDAEPGGSPATILPRLSTGEPAWVAAFRLALVKAGRNLGAGIERIIRALPIVADVPRAIARCGFMNVFLGAQRILASLDRYTLVRWLNWITRNHLPPPRSMYSSVGLDNCAGLVPIVTAAPISLGPAAQSLSMSEAHRLLRRARVFGPALLDPAVLTDPTNLAGRKSLLEIADDGIARGIHFFCVNANIRSQFEFVQQTWCNNPRFAGLNDNKDPILGDNARPNQTPSRMTIPRQPFPVRTAALPRVVHVKAGAYLFMPSITALRFLAAIEQ